MSLGRGQATPVRRTLLSLLPMQADVAQMTGMPPDILSQMQANVLAALANDTASISGEQGARDSGYM